MNTFNNCIINIVNNPKDEKGFSNWLKEITKNLLDTKNIYDLLVIVWKFATLIGPLIIAYNPIFMAFFFN